MKIKKPSKPVKGRGFERVQFPFNRGTAADQVKAAFYDALPDEHKGRVAVRRRGGYFGGFSVISPEAMELWNKGKQE